MELTGPNYTKWEAPWLECLAVVRKVTGSSPARAKRLENSHCPPSSEWVPYQLQGRLKVVKGEDWALPFTCCVQDTMGNTPLPRRPLGYGHLYHVYLTQIYIFYMLHANWRNYNSCLHWHWLRLWQNTNNVGWEMRDPAVTCMSDSESQAS